MPSLTTATLLARQVKAKALFLSSAMARQTRATPGVYTIDSVLRVLTATLRTSEDFAAQMQQKDAVGGRTHAHAGHGAQTLHDVLGVGLALGVEGDVADHLVAAHLDDVDGAEVGAFLGQ